MASFIAEIKPISRALVTPLSAFREAFQLAALKMPQRDQSVRDTQTW